MEEEEEPCTCRSYIINVLNISLFMFLITKIAYDEFIRLIHGKI